MGTADSALVMALDLARFIIASFYDNDCDYCLFSEDDLDTALWLIRQVAQDLSIDPSQTRH